MMDEEVNEDIKIKNANVCDLIKKALASKSKSRENEGSKIGGEAPSVKSAAENLETTKNLFSLGSPTLKSARPDKIITYDPYNPDTLKYKIK